MRNEKYKELFEKYKELSEDYLSLQRMVKLILLTRERKKYGYSEPLFFDDHCKMFYTLHEIDQKRIVVTEDEEKERTEITIC